ncbi:MAG TPA: hypothetical protein VF334_12035 [Polyangia bacterium]
MVAALALGAAGCLSSIIPDHHQETTVDGGSSTGGPADNPQQSGGGGNPAGDGGSAAPADMATANDPNCIAPATPQIDGHHNAGMACLQCHDGNTAGANKFTAAGTVYDKLSLAAGAQGLSGVTIEITDANGTKVSVVTASQGAAGNFWTDQTLVFPLTVRASACPADRPMTETVAAAANVAAGGGNCSRSGCHDSNMIIHVP